MGVVDAVGVWEVGRLVALWCVCVCAVCDGGWKRWKWWCWWVLCFFHFFELRIFTSKINKPVFNNFDLRIWKIHVLSSILPKQVYIVHGAGSLRTLQSSVFTFYNISILVFVQTMRR